MSVDTAIVARVSARLLAAYELGEPIDPVRDELAGGGIEAAYAVQEATISAWVASGRRVVGHKIGLTSVAVQRQLGVDQPDSGVLMADMSLVDGEPIGPVLQPRVEAEVALVLGQDLDAPDVTLAELLRAIDFVLPAIEVVGSRIKGWDITILDTIADNASSGMFVLGTQPVRPRDIELRDVGMTLEVDGRNVAVGSGAACLGHPYRAALWLARRTATLGRPLRAGDVVMTGALGPMADLPPGSTASATIQGLGTVRTRNEGTR